jgi:hypothetical protein
MTSEGDGGPSLLIVPFPDLLAAGRQPDDVLKPAFDVIERWAGRA